MKKYSFKHYSLIILLSVFACLSTIQIKSAFGAPTQNPPGSTLSPTFTQVNIGESTDQVQITKDGLSKTGVATPFVLNANSRVMEIATGVVFRVLTELKVLGTSNLATTNIGSEFDPKDLKVFGKSVFIDNLETAGNVTIGTTDKNRILSVKGDIYGKDLYVTTLEADSIGGNTYDGFTVNGHLFGELIEDVRMSDIRSFRYIDGVEGKFSGWVRADNISSFTSSGSINIASPVTIGGSVKATSFGTLTNRELAITSSTLNELKTVTAACNSGEIPISCDYYVATTSNQWLVFNQRLQSTGCQIAAKNMMASGTANKITAQALCWKTN